MLDGDVLGERTPVRESGLGLALAYLRVAGRACRAPPAGADERGGDAVAGTPPGHIAADRLDDTGQLMPRHMRKFPDIGVVTHPAVPVAPAQPGSLHPDHGARARRLGVGHVADLRLPAEPVVQHRAHRLLRPPDSATEQDDCLLSDTQQRTGPNAQAASPASVSGRGRRMGVSSPAIAISRHATPMTRHVAVTP